MNRRQRRAFAKALGKALGRSGARPQAPGPVAERLEKLEREKADLQAQVNELRGQTDAVPGVREGRKDWWVLVGGDRVDLRAITPAEWIKSMEELPDFLFTFAVERATQPGRQLTAGTLTQIHELASRWIKATATDPASVDLDRLTLPEAEHALVHIAELNGVTAHMRAWFRQRLEGVAGDPPGSEELRDETEQPAGDLPN